MEPLAGVHHVAFSVSDLETSISWYCDVLGMVEQFRENSPTRKAAVLSLPDRSSSVGLVEHAASPRASFDPTATGLDHFAFSVRSQEDLRRWADHLDRHPISHSGPIEVPPGEILNFKDPDGIALALFWDR